MQKRRRQHEDLVHFPHRNRHIKTPAGVLAAPQEPGSVSSLQAIVQIIHTREQRKGNSLLIQEGASLGTVIGPHLVLTHNHFGATLGTLPNETFTFTDSTGLTFRVRVDEVKRIAIDKGTLLLRLPDTVNLTVCRSATRPPSID